MDLSIKVLNQPMSVVGSQTAVSHHLHSLHLDTRHMIAEECGNLSYLIRICLLEVSKSKTNDKRKHLKIHRYSR